MDDTRGLVVNKHIIELANNLPSSVQKKLISVAVESVVNTQSHSFNKVLKGGEITLTSSNLLDLAGLYISLVRLFSETNEKQFDEALLTLGFSKEFTKNFPLKSVGSSVSSLLTSSESTVKVTSFKWRIDISFSGIRNVRIPPIVIICMQLSDGRKFIFEADLHTFHKLRFTIALIFKEFNNLKLSASRHKSIK